jgi:Rrf2 family transcriptional regulator, nitric oxide-sensitive transcriptional repressor
MRLTRYTDYAMRVLLHLAARGDDDGLASIGEIAALYDISQNHLMKVVQDLGKAGFVRTVRGRGGGIALARPADQIIVGHVVRQTEEGFQLVDCTNCRIAPACTLPRALNEATAAFIAVLDKYTLEDLLDKRHQMRTLFGITDPAELAEAAT